MRVTQNSNFNSVRDTVHTTKSHLEDLQSKAATMKKLNVPSDDPVGASKVLEVRTDKTNNVQYARSAQLAEGLMNHADHALDSLTEILIRAKEIAINQASGASSTDETRLGVAEEVEQLFQQALGAANTRVGERYLFAGYQTASPAVDSEGKYRGDAGEVLVEVAKNVFVPSNVPGLLVFNTNPMQSADAKRVYKDEPQPADKAQKPADNQEPQMAHTEGRAPASLGHMDEAPAEEKKSFAKYGQENVNLFQEIQNLKTSLLTGDLEGIRDTLERFDQIHANVVGMRAKMGARVAGLQNTMQTLDRHNITSAHLTSSIEDADMAEVMSNIAKEETILNAVLGTSKKLIMPTLMDFLR